MSGDWPKVPPRYDPAIDRRVIRGWVRRQRDDVEQHRCPFPAATAVGDLWRCHQCRTLWRVGEACDVCDAIGGRQPHHGMCAVGPNRWRRAYWLQRLRWLGKGRS